MYTFDDNIISDLHKDARGFRPTESFWNAWNAQDDEGKQTVWNILVDEMNRAMEQQAKDEAAALVEFRRIIAAQMQTCNCNWKTALEYLADAEDIDVTYEQDFDYFLWNQGIGYEDRIKIRKLYREE